MSLQINHAQRQAFREIFKLATSDGKSDGKLDKEGLDKIFQHIDYKCSEKQLEEFHQKLFSKKDAIEFTEFMNIFKLKMSDYTGQDVQNAFKLLARDDDKYIPQSLIKDILVKNGMTEVEVVFICNQLGPYTDQNGNVNYQDFLQSLSL